MQSGLSLHSAESQLFPAEPGWKQTKWIIVRMRLHWFGTQYTLPCLFCTLQTWHLHCKGANLSACKFVSLCVLEVCVSRHKRKFPKTPHCCSKHLLSCTSHYWFHYEVFWCILCFSLLYSMFICHADNTVCPVQLQWSLTAEKGSLNTLNRKGDDAYTPVHHWITLWRQW